MHSQDDYSDHLFSQPWRLYSVGVGMVNKCSVHEPMTSHHLVPNRVHLTEARLALLRSHILRTGVAIPALLKMHKKETKGITYKIVYDWLRGRVKTADAGHFKALIKIYKELPDQDEIGRAHV